MKTINNIQETGNNKNSTMKTIAVLVSVAMMGFIFQAGANNKTMPGSALDNFPSNTANAAITTAFDASSVTASYMEAATEESLGVESWMTNENHFVPLAVSESEEPMEVEEWMTNTENFRETTFTEESDQALEVESWMLTNKNFSTFTITEETEQALEVQDWMLNENRWGM